MLSSTADNLYWMGRYIERAENTARLLAASNRMSLIAGQNQVNGRGGGWRSVATIYGVGPATLAAEGGAPEEALLRTLCFDRDNHSSIVGCVQRARNNARAERNNLTSKRGRTSTPPGSSSPT